MSETITVVSLLVSVVFYSMYAEQKRKLSELSRERRNHKRLGGIKNRNRFKNFRLN